MHPFGGPARRLACRRRSAACSSGDRLSARRRGRVLARAAPEMKGKWVGEEEEVAGELTAGSVRAEDGRMMEVDVRGGASSGQQWWPAGAGLNRSG